jgi:predicted transcriptional regulator
MEEIVKFHKRKKLFTDGCKEKNIKKTMENLDKIYKLSGVETKSDYSDLSHSNDEMNVLVNPGLTSTDITEDHKSFLKIIKKKALPTAQAYKLMNQSSRKCDRIKNDLIAQGLIEVNEVKDRRGLTKMLSLTEKGLGFLTLPK